MGFKDDKRATGFRRYWPVLGFFLIVVLGVISYFLAPSVIDWAADNLNGFTGRELPQLTMRIGFAVVIFVVLLSIFGLILAAFAPKRKLDTVKDADLVKSRAEMLKRREEEKRRQRKINQQMRGR